MVQDVVKSGQTPMLHWAKTTLYNRIGLISQVSRCKQISYKLLNQTIFSDIVNDTENIVCIIHVVRPRINTSIFEFSTCDIWIFNTFDRRHTKINYDWFVTL